MDFTWYPALGYQIDRPTSQNNLKFELANILYNLAALYSQLAISSNRGTTDGLKVAANYFCQAAGVISHIKDVVIPELRSSPPEDMDDSTLESLLQLLLAQAQESVWQKAVMDGYKDASIAKLAAKVSDFYGAAGEWAVKSNSVSAEWIHHTAAKHHHFAAAAQYRQACDCLEKRKYGEEVARLRDSIACVNEGLKEARYVNKVVLSDLNGLKNKVAEDLKRAEKDNDLIYLSKCVTSDVSSSLTFQVLFRRNQNSNHSIEPTWRLQKFQKKFRLHLSSWETIFHLAVHYSLSLFHSQFILLPLFTKNEEID